MKVQQLISIYEEHISKTPNANSIFSNSGMKNVTAVLDFGFFPLGSGILKEGKSKVAEAEIEKCKIMVLGNDFGTQEYISNQCSENREKSSNPTIRNLLNGLELDVETTFFTNLFLGLRNEGTNIKRQTPLRNDYKNFCFSFLKAQLDFFNPDTVLCLGKDVAKALADFSIFSRFKTSISKLFHDESSSEYIIQTDDEFFGKRKFVLIPHPSFAHINWGKNDIKKKIREAILI